MRIDQGFGRRRPGGPPAVPRRDPALAEIPTSADDGLPVAVVAALIDAVARAGMASGGEVGRRRELLRALARIAGADAVAWGWGRAGSTAIVGGLDIGLDARQRAQLSAWWHGGEASGFVDWLRRRTSAARRPATAIVTGRDLDGPELGTMLPALRLLFGRAGWGSCLLVVRPGGNASGDLSGLLMLRRDGRIGLDPGAGAIAGLVLDGVPWLHAGGARLDDRDGLTPRQRAVLDLVLDGLSRKAIAGRLGIAEGTVGDHIKAIYARFGVSSAGQLAALFFRNA